MSETIHEWAKWEAVRLTRSKDYAFLSEWERQSVDPIARALAAAYARGRKEAKADAEDEVATLYHRAFLGELTADATTALLLAREAIRMAVPPLPEPPAYLTAGLKPKEA